MFVNSSEHYTQNIKSQRSNIRYLGHEHTKMSRRTWQTQTRKYTITQAHRHMYKHTNTHTHTRRTHTHRTQTQTQTSIHMCMLVWVTHWVSYSAGKTQNTTQSHASSGSNRGKFLLFDRVFCRRTYFLENHQQKYLDIPHKRHHM